MVIDGIPLPDPKRPTCANCRWNVNMVCKHFNRGNCIVHVREDEYNGKPITWDASAVHCGQHQYAK